MRYWKDIFRFSMSNFERQSRHSAECSWINCESNKENCSMWTVWEDMCSVSLDKDWFWLYWLKVWSSDIIIFSFIKVQQSEQTLILCILFINAALVSSWKTTSWSLFNLNVKMLLDDCTRDNKNNELTLNLRDVLDLVRKSA